MGPTLPRIPSPCPNLLGGGDAAPEPFSCTSHATHAHPGPSPREIRRIHSNAPSESDHPMFGLHDPLRKVRLGKMVHMSLAAETFAPPHISSYAFTHADPPYPDTAHRSLSFDHNATMGLHQTEQQSKYLWPKWSVPAPAMKPVAQLVIE